MNGQVLDDPIGELAVDSPVIVDTVPVDVVPLEEGQDRPLIKNEIGVVYPPVSGCWPSEGWVAFCQCLARELMVEREEAHDV